MYTFYICIYVSIYMHVYDANECIGIYRIDRQIDRYTDRQIDRQTYIYIYIYIYYIYILYISEHKKNGQICLQEKSVFKQFFETLLRAMKMSTGFTTDIIWVDTKVYSVTSEPTQSSSKRVSSFKDSSALLNN